MEKKKTKPDNKIGLYVVQCIKGNNNQFGFGYKHKKNQFVNFEGTVNNIALAYIYDDCFQEEDNSCSLAKDSPIDWGKYYRLVPITMRNNITFNLS